MSSRQRTVPISRVREGRWIGGVCAGLGTLRGLRTGWLRAGFVLLALLGGLGIGLYLACWLIIPAGRAGFDPEPGGGAVEVAQACAAGVGLAVLAAIAAVATLFGFGWVVLGLAVAALALVLWARDRVGPAWALLPVIALTVPAVAVAASGLRLTPQTGASTFAPATSAQLSTRVYRSGLGTILIDLRHTAFPAGGVVPIRIDAGVKRTIVALPAHECVRVDLHYHVHTFVAAAGSLLAGREAPYSYVTLFGRLYTQRSDQLSAGGSGPYPTLKVDFSSQGGSLYVRDYPDSVDPDVNPDWPGYVSPPEPRPDLRVEPRRLRKTIMRAYRHRLRLANASRKLVERLLPGPCG
jgi:phage shock protein PspC (stress-responsive transcriptional regulator)